MNIGQGVQRKKPAKCSNDINGSLVVKEQGGERRDEPGQSEKRKSDNQI